MDSQLGLMLLEQSPCMLSIFSLKNKKFKYVSKHAEYLLGITSDKVYEKGLEFLYTLIHPEDQQRVSKKFEDFINKSGKNRNISKDYWTDCKYRLKNKYGDYIYVKSRKKICSFDEDGLPDIVLNITLEITKEEMYLDTANYENYPDNFLSLSAEYCHHLNNSLQGLTLAKSKILKKYPDCHEVAKLGQQLEEIFSRLLSVSHKLLEHHQDQ